MARSNITITTKGWVVRDNNADPDEIVISDSMALVWLSMSHDEARDLRDQLTGWLMMIDTEHDQYTEDGTRIVPNEEEL